MNQIYQRAEGGQIALYQEGNKIMAALLTMRRGIQPTVQKADCLGGLTSALFQGSIFFAYENLEHQVAVDVVGGGRERIVLTEGTDRCKFRDFILTVQGELLVLLYQSWNPVKERFEVHAIAPYLPDLACRIRECGSDPVKLTLLEWEGQQFLLAAGEKPGGGAVYRLKGQMDWEENGEPERQAEEERRRLQAEREAVYREQIEELRKDREKVIESCQEEAESQRQALEDAWSAWKVQADAEKEELEQLLRNKDEEMKRLVSEQGKAAAADERIQRLKKEYEAQLASARLQYDELAGTAAELQRIGKMWRDKCYQMEGRDQ